MPASFESFVLVWLSTVAIVGLKDTGYSEYEAICRNHLVPAFGDKPVDAMTPADVQAYIADRVSSGLSPRTVVNHVHVLRRVLDHAVRYGLVVGNAARMVTLPRVERVEMRFLTPQQVHQLIEATAPSWRLLVAMAALTGLRKAEQLALRFADVDLEAGLIHVSRSLRSGVVRTPKTTASVAAVPLPTSLVPLLEERRHKAPDPHGLIFCRANGDPLSDAVPNRILSAALARAGLPQIRWHDLRHSFVVAHLQAGTDIPTLQRLGRWKSADTLLSVYAHMLPAAGGEAARRLDEIVSEEGQTEQADPRVGPARPKQHQL